MPPRPRNITEQLRADFFASFYLSRGDPSVQEPIFRFLAVDHWQSNDQMHTGALSKWIMQNPRPVLGLRLPKGHVELVPQAFQAEKVRASKEFFDFLQEGPTLQLGNAICDFSQPLVVHELDILTDCMNGRTHAGNILPDGQSLFREHVLLGKTAMLLSSHGARKLCQTAGVNLPDNLTQDVVLRDAFIELEWVWQALQLRCAWLLQPDRCYPRKCLSQISLYIYHQYVAWS